MSQANAKQAMIFSERLREEIASLVVDYQGTKIQFTVSLGICPLSESIETPQHWLEKADQALYKSKEGGRNKSSIAS